MRDFRSIRRKDLLREVAFVWRRVGRNFHAVDAGVSADFAHVGQFGPRCRHVGVVAVGIGDGAGAADGTFSKLTLFTSPAKGAEL